MNYTQEITLDVEPGSASCCPVNAKQGDGGTRFVRVTLLCGGVPLELPAGVTARFRCRKPDGHSVDDPATVNADGTVTAELTEQVLAVPGNVLADIVLKDAAGDTLSTATFLLLVDKAPQGNGIASSNEFLTLQAIIKEGNALIERLNQKAEEQIPDALPNPEALTLGGVSYNGSMPVDLTEPMSALIKNALEDIENGTY